MPGVEAPAVNALSSQGGPGRSLSLLYESAATAGQTAPTWLMCSALVAEVELHFEHTSAVGKLADAESMALLKDFMNRLGCDNTRHEALPVNMDADSRGSYIANSAVLGVDSADYVLFIGTNPRAESPVYNARVRKAVLNGTKVSPQCLPSSG